MDQSGSELGLGAKEQGWLAKTVRPRRYAKCKAARRKL
jgi:hypothetical protein